MKSSFQPVLSSVHGIGTEFFVEDAEVGDPLLCSAGSLEEFGRPVFPRGASLVGHFKEYRNPGHFVGKGWIQLTFDRMVLPDVVLPLSTKVVQVPHLVVDPKERMPWTRACWT